MHDYTPQKICTKYLVGFYYANPQLTPVLIGIILQIFIVKLSYLDNTIPFNTISQKIMQFRAYVIRITDYIVQWLLPTAEPRTAAAHLFYLTIPEKRNVPTFLHFCIVYWKQLNCLINVLSVKSILMMIRFKIT